MAVLCSSTCAVRIPSCLTTEWVCGTNDIAAIFIFAANILLGFIASSSVGEAAV